MGELLTEAENAYRGEISGGQGQILLTGTSIRDIFNIGPWFWATSTEYDLEVLRFYFKLSRICSGLVSTLDRCVHSK